MILCDIGNTNATFFENGKIYKLSISEFQKYTPKEKVYFICVNDKILQTLNNRANFINLEPYFEIKTEYQGLGIDRIAGCYEIEDGVIVDAGSAITIDIMKKGRHIGGYILIGMASMLKAYEEISPRLKTTINSQIELHKIPQKTSDAINLGIIKPITALIENLAKDKKVYFTGGDGQFLSTFFKNSIYHKTLVFHSMQKLIIQKGLQ